MKLLRKILIPIAPVYYIITWLRNKLYDFGIKKSKSYDFPIICVGNLSVGGTGKTPMIEYLIRILKDKHRVATLSRGYKRQTKGFQMADEKSEAETIGDEPFQFYNKFGKVVLVSVDANRQNGITELQKQKNKPNVILLDDAYQHRKVKAGFNILLTTYANPYFDDYVLPAGNLREPRHGANRANIIVVTKCPNILSELEKEKFVNRIQAHSNQDVFFSSIKYSDKVVSANSDIELNDLPYFTLVTGIANSMPLVNFFKDKSLKFEHLNFKDHHEFSQQDISNLNKKELIIATEKDFMRLKQYESLKNKLFYLPIEVLIDNDVKFNKLIENFVIN